MENSDKRRFKYTHAEQEKRDELICYIVNELDGDLLSSYTTEFLSDLAEFIENYGFDD